MLVSILSRTSSGKKKEATQFDPHETVAHKRKKARYKKRKKRDSGLLLFKLGVFIRRRKRRKCPLAWLAPINCYLLQEKKRGNLPFFFLLFTGLSAGGIKRKRRRVIAIQKTTPADKRESKKKKNGRKRY